MSIGLQVGTYVENKIYIVNGQQLGLMVWHAAVTTPFVPGPTDLDYLTDLQSTMTPLLTPMLSVDSVVYGYSSQVISIVPKPPPAQYLTGGTAGTVAGNTLPRQVSGIFTLRTAATGRAYRGRKYMPFPPQTFNSSAFSPNLTYYNLLDTFATDLIRRRTIAGHGGTVDMMPVIFHRHTLSGANITGQTTRQLWATQRRRGDYGRTNILPF